MSPRRPGGLGPLAGLVVLTVLAAACSGGDDAGAGPAIDDTDGLADEGVELVGDLADEAPRYRLTATIDPATGELAGTVHADLPVEAAATAHLRFFAALVDPAAAVDDITVDGDAVQAELDSSLLSVPLGSRGDRVELTASFRYTVPVIPADDSLGGLGSLGEGLQPADIGLLGRDDGIVTLGHWFPVWIPDGLDAEPRPQGFGDIGNFPAAVVEAQVEVPEGWELVSGGVRLSEDGAHVVEGGVGLRDLGMVLVEAAETVEVPVGSTTVRVVGTEDAAVLDEVADEAATSLATLSSRLGAYPWTELEVVSTPLGSGVGGMEWPGMVWIEEGIFAGFLPGLGDLGDILGDLGDLGDLGGLGDAFDPDVLAATRAWTVAHEVGHQWWHAMVGNDSMLSPTVDEPLAQHAACLVFQTAWPENAEAVCEANTSGGYEQMRLFGEPDAPAAQPSDAFASSLQYGGVVYGKAPGVYDALAAAFGEDALVEALAGVVAEHAFELITVDQLRTELAEQLGDAATVESLWAHWMDETHGDEDLSVEPGAFGGDLAGLEDLLTEILEQLGD